MQSAGMNSNSSNNLFLFPRPFSEKILLLQILVGIFLYINSLMMYTFLKKEMFREETRYILFAQTLFVDSAFILLCDLLSVGTFFQYPVHMGVCTLSFAVMNFLTFCTPLTLVAMCLERYVAICMPLRHADISTRKTRLYGFLIIFILSTIIPVFGCIAYWAAAPPLALFSYEVCNSEIMLVEEWQAHSHAAMHVILFLLMVIIIVFTYIKIMSAARAASSEKKESTNKSLRTVLLHGAQLFLCMMQLFNPYIEMTYYNVDEMILRNIKYSNLIVFLFVPRSLSPLVYGLRDEKFSRVLRQYALWGTEHHFSKLFDMKKLKNKTSLNIQ